MKRRVYLRAAVRNVSTKGCHSVVDMLRFLQKILSRAHEVSTQQTLQCCSWCMEYRGTQPESAINAWTELFQMHLEQRPKLTVGQGWIATLRS